MVFSRITMEISKASPYLIVKQHKIKGYTHDYQKLDYAN
jgi:hypothetical protein